LTLKNVFTDAHMHVMSCTARTVTELVAMTSSNTDVSD